MSPASNAVDEAGDELALRARAGKRRRFALPGRDRAFDAWRARCSALFTETSVTPSISATSPARKASTSRSTSTARWRGGSAAAAVTNASPIASRAS